MSSGRDALSGGRDASPFGAIFALLGIEAKDIAHALGCSFRQSRRIKETGNCPRSLERRLLDFLKRTAAFRRAELEQSDKEIAARIRVYELMEEAGRMSAEIITVRRA